MQVREWGEARRMLVARLDNAGDVLLAGPVLRAIRETCPGITLTLWASPSGSRMAELLPEVDEIFTSRVLWQDLGHLEFEPRRERQLISALRQGRFDAAIILTSFAQSPHPPAYACYLAGIPLRAGQSREFAGSVLSDAVSPSPDGIHQAERNLHLIRSLGFEARSADLAVRIPDEARDALGLNLRLHGVGLGRPFVLMHPGASCSSRRYPADRFAEVGRRLWTALTWPIVISGAESERETVRAMAAEIGPGAVPFAGETTLPELAALVERATVVVTNNTVTMHLADAVRTPEVVLFAGTELECQWQPRITRARLLRRPTPCQPCYRFQCPYDLQCLDLAPSEVAAAVLELISEPAR